MSAAARRQAVVTALEALTDVNVYGAAPQGLPVAPAVVLVARDPYRSLIAFGDGDESHFAVRMYRLLGAGVDLMDACDDLADDVLAALDNGSGFDYTWSTIGAPTINEEEGRSYLTCDIDIDVTGEGSA